MILVEDQISILGFASVSERKSAWSGNQQPSLTRAIR